MNRKALRKMMFFHIILFVALLMFPLYTFVMKKVSGIFGGCFLHDWFFLYCPACGGTRAAEALLRLDVLSALRYNALAVMFAIVAVAFYAKAWIRLNRREERLIIFPNKFWTVCSILIVSFFVLRNLLLIIFGIDPLGDLAWFWNQIR